MSVGGVSFTMVRARDLYPRKPLLQDPSPSSSSSLSPLSPPFIPLPGEDLLFLGLVSAGVPAALSTYRLYVETSPRINLPLGLVEALELRDLSTVALLTKDGRLARFNCRSPAVAEEWLKRISSLSNPASLGLEDVFAFGHAAWHAQENQLLSGEESFLQQSGGGYQEWFHEEIARLKFDLQGAWRISSANKDYKLCATYPEELLIPSCISDAMLEKIAQFRSAQRITAILWRHQSSGAVLARCSQPEVGWLGWRSTEDEQMVKALADACAWDRGSVSHQPLSSSDEEEEEYEGEGSEERVQGMQQEEEREEVSRKEAAVLEKQKKVLIIDARSYAAAFGNRARGGGVECPEYYPNTEIEFMSLANIHYIRKSFQSLRNLLSASPPCDPSSWFGALDGTKWLTHMSGLLKAAVRVTSALEIEGRPVIVHCSDGWDRTPQIVSLSQLLLDPFYRTCEGFRVLVEKEWLDFGHKMADRCGLPGGASDPNERSPIFLQWCDCVHQLLLQFPCSFEFNQSYLVKLAQHTYSSLFGTFLCNNQQERVRNNVAERTRSVWTYLNEETFRNFLYKSQEETLWPRCEVRDLSLWRNIFASSEGRLRFPVESSVGESSTEGSENEGGSSSESAILVKENSGSCQSTESSQNGSGCDRRRLSISSSPRAPPSAVLSSLIESSTDTLVPEEGSSQTSTNLSEEEVLSPLDGLFFSAGLCPLPPCRDPRPPPLTDSLPGARTPPGTTLPPTTPGRQGGPPTRHRARRGRGPVRFHNI
eukprot:TRINITY_DN1816_c0_g1_i1.p1 TRINITY_DN1816_c0_g1~~TRINITY_DN1816_c0_g1_i1.p1  ORF type:complete len:765 (-),score=237.99 TRINITY_DN1816_c0_g1_i1:758-3052(-)